jgi:anti-anti-sigma factor
MKLKLKKINNVFIVNLIGDLNIHNSYKLKETFLSLIKDNTKNVIFNLNKTSSIDFTGIGVFIYCFNMSKKLNIKLCLCNVKGVVAKLINLTNLNNFFNITKNIKTSLDLLNHSESSF